MNEKENPKDKNIQDVLSQDGSAISSWITDMSTKAKTIGRQVVFALIATSWTLAYTKGEFTPHPLIKWALMLALVYVFLDLLYYVASTAFYKYILLEYFEPIDGGFKHKVGKDSDSITRVWLNIGFWWLVIMSLVMLVSSGMMIIYIIRL